MASIFDNSSRQKNMLSNSNQVTPILGGPTSTSSSAPKTQQPQQGPATSGAYNNLSNYLKANQNNNLANRVVNQSQKQANQVKNDVNTAVSNFQSGAQDASRETERAGVEAEKAIQEIGSGTPSQTQIDNTSKAMEGEYKGPTDIANRTSLASGVSNISNMASNVDTESGRFSLLRQLMGRQGYNKGQQMFDQMLLQGDQKQLQGLNAIKRQAAETSKTFEDATGQVANTVQNNIQQAAQVADSTKKAAEGALGALKQRAENAVTDKKSQISSQQAPVLKAIKDISEGTKDYNTSKKFLMDKFGLSADSQLWGLPASELKNYISMLDPSMVNIYNAADENLYKSYNNLSTLLKDPTKNIFANKKYGDEKLGDVLTYDTKSLSNKISGRSSDWATKTNPLVNQLRAEEAKYNDSKKFMDRIIKSGVRDLKFGGNSTLNTATARKLAEVESSLYNEAKNASNPLIRDAAEKAYRMSTGPTKSGLGSGDFYKNLESILNTHMTDVVNSTKSGTIADLLTNLNNINTEYGQGVYTFGVNPNTGTMVANTGPTLAGGTGSPLLPKNTDINFNNPPKENEKVYGRFWDFLNK